MVTKATPLLGLLRALEPEQRQAFAQAVGTTVVYLYQLAAQPLPNPRLRLALAICEESKKYAEKRMTPVLTLDDLLVGTGDEPFPTSRTDG
jgi:hypothetical protein